MPDDATKDAVPIRLEGSRADDPGYRLIGRIFRLLPRLPRFLVAALLASGEGEVISAKDQHRLGVESAVRAGVPVHWIGRQRRAAGVIVCLHGGAYISGPGRESWDHLATLSESTGLAGVLIQYRMPPRHPFPAALDDVRDVLSTLELDRDLPQGRWFIFGDSAGGGLALAIVQQLRSAGASLPAGLVLTAPAVDLTLQNPELDQSEPLDAILHRSWLGWAARLYAGSVPLGDPRLSPINGSFDGFPPVHLNVGTRDLLLPDVRRLLAAMKRAGVVVDYVEQPGGVHDYALQLPRPEAVATVADQARWIAAQLA